MPASLERVYLFSDTFGEALSADAPRGGLDPDALTATDFRSGRFLFNKPWREFDTLKTPGVTDHILRHIVALHDQIDQCLLDGFLHGLSDERFGITGVMINSAPRVDTAENGALFHLATAHRGAIRVVAPLTALSSIKHIVETLQVLPNNNNGLFSNNEQFRSSYVPYLLQPDHGISLRSREISDIPDAPKDWRVAYVDRFGNIVTFDNRPQDQREQISSQTRLRIGQEVFRDVFPATSLREARPGAISLYGNDGNRDVVYKWTPNDVTAQQRLDRSAWNTFGQPNIGDPVSIAS